MMVHMGTVHLPFVFLTGQSNIAGCLKNKYYCFIYKWPMIASAGLYHLFLAAFLEALKSRSCTGTYAHQERYIDL